MMEDGALKLCDFGAAVAIDPATGRVAAMPAEIGDLENQFVEKLGGPQPAQPSLAAMTPYSLRKVTQVRCTAPLRCKHANARAITRLRRLLSVCRARTCTALRSAATSPTCAR